MGMPEPMSRNWRMPYSAVRVRVARIMKSRLARAAGTIWGRVATAASAARTSTS